MLCLIKQQNYSIKIISFSYSIFHLFVCAPPFTGPIYFALFVADTSPISDLLLPSPIWPGNDHECVTCYHLVSRATTLCHVITTADLWARGVNCPLQTYPAAVDKQANENFHSVDYTHGPELLLWLHSADHCPGPGEKSHRNNRFIACRNGIIACLDLFSRITRSYLLYQILICCLTFCNLFKRGKFA